MKYTVRFKKSAAKEMEQLPRQVAKRVAEAIDGLSENPRPLGCKKLEGQKETLWRIRTGDYRIIYSIQDVVHILEIRRIGHRKNVYD